MANEAFARIKIDRPLKDADWTLTDARSARFECPSDDGGKANFVLFDRQGRSLAMLEAKSTSVDLSAGEAQGCRYADQLAVPC
ncbi:MAG: DEAD/DEAH box helicase family protein, partial [Acidimicrobiales bacterium]